MFRQLSQREGKQRNSFWKCECIRLFGISRKELGKSKKFHSINISSLHSEGYTGKLQSRLQKNDYLTMDVDLIIKFESYSMGCTSCLYSTAFLDFDWFKYFISFTMMSSCGDIIR